MNKKLLLTYGGLLFLAIAVFSLIIRSVSGNETLLEYAHKNPDLAYGDKIPKEEAPHTNNVTASDRMEGSDLEAYDTSITTAASDSDTEKKPSQTSASTATVYEEEGSEPSSDSYIEKENSATMLSERITYQEGFYYEPLSEELLQRITGISYPALEETLSNTDSSPVNTLSPGSIPAVQPEELRYVSLLHYNLKGIVRTGELICHQSIAQDLVEIFYELYRNQYQIEQIQLIDEYQGDDKLSMQDNNTSCFNYRLIDGTDTLSQHAYGLAIDINPFYNPYVVYHDDGSTYISPPSSETYADRSRDFAYKIDENDLCYKLFTEHGFTWGGHWNSMKDYQHFQKPAQ